MKRILSMIAVLVTVLSFGLVNTLYSKGNTLVVGGEAADRDKLPHIWWNAGAQDYYMSSLLFTDENQNPGKNDLAASREYDENSNTYRFVLRDGVEFHDGTKLTSEDIRWNVRVCLETPRVTPITKNALKSIEGVAGVIKHFIKSEFKKNLYNKFSSLVSFPVLNGVKEKMDPRVYNGASFLGLNGIVVKSHGSADSFAYCNAIKTAYYESKNNLINSIREYTNRELNE